MVYVNRLKAVLSIVSILFIVTVISGLLYVGLFATGSILLTEFLWRIFAIASLTYLAGYAMYIIEFYIDIVKKEQGIK